MAFEHPHGSFVHAASYASLMLQVAEHLFPDQKLFSLSAEQRRIASNETEFLLYQARLRVDSKQFAEYFATPQPTPEMAPEGTVLGREVPKPKPQEPDTKGHYM